MSRQKRHNWLVPHEGKVACANCGIEVPVDEARRGVGPCVRKWKVQVEKPVEKPILEPLELGTCGACGKPLHQSPFNSSRDMICCVNIRCDLYRQRLRYVPALSVAERKERKDAERVARA